MKSICIFFLIFCCSTAYAFQSKPGEEDPKKPLNLERLEGVTDSLVYSLINGNLVTGLSVAVAMDDKIIFSAGYGLANMEHGVKATAETVYKTGSITKQFTAAAILKLAEEGKLTLNDSLGKYFPEYPAHGAGITIQQLLDHTSGIGSEKYKNKEDKKLAGRKSLFELSKEEMLAMFANAPLEFEPGENFAYRNQNYILLGMIIEQISNKSFELYIEEDFLKPLGLHNTRYCNESSLIQDRAQGYIFVNGKIYNAPYMNMKNPGAAGGLCSTVRDLVLWNHLLHSGKVISRNSLDQMTSSKILNNRPTGYGFGLKSGSLGQNKKIYHGGSIPGFNAVLEFYPETGLTIAVMTNTGSTQDERISEALARAAFGLEIKQLHLAGADREKYEGSYIIHTSGKAIMVRFYSKEDQLQVDLVGEGISPLLYQGGDRFVAAYDKDMVFTFIKEGQEYPEIRVEMQGKVLAAKRKEEN